MKQHDLFAISDASGVTCVKGQGGLLFEIIVFLEVKRET